MITIDVLVKQLVGLREPDLQRWIELAYVRPQGSPGRWFFREIDVARVQLLMTLQSELQTNFMTQGGSFAAWLKPSRSPPAMSAAACLMPPSAAAGRYRTPVCRAALLPQAHASRC